MKTCQMVVVLVEELRHLRLLPCLTWLKVLKHIVTTCLSLNISKFQGKLQKHSTISLQLGNVSVLVEVEQRAPWPAWKSYHQAEGLLLPNNRLGTFAIFRKKKIETSLQ
jgi:hypothetical protein